MTRDEIEEEYGWGSDEEREAALAETAARQKRLDYENAVALALQQKAEREQRAEQQERDRKAAERAAEQQPEPNGATKMATNSTEAWADFVRREIKASLNANSTAMLGAVSDVLGEERKALKDEIVSERSARQTLEVEHAVTRQELQTLRNELSELRGELKAKSAISDLETRMARIEQERSARTPLRTVGTALTA